MKDGACTHCKGTEIYEIEEARIPNYESSNGVDALTLTAHYGASGGSGMFGVKSARSVVRISAYVCAACAYTELYAQNLDVLDRLASTSGTGVHKVTRS